MADELEILLPERTLMVNGLQVTVHEYTLAEQLQHRQPLREISGGLSEAMSAAPEAEIPLETLFDVLGERWPSVVKALAVSCGQPVEWVSELTGEDSETLLLTWWGVNADFFTRNAIRPALEKLVRDLQSASAGPKSSPASSTTDTSSAT